MGSDPWTPSKALPWGPYSTPRPPDPQLARAMTFACRHDIIKNPTNFWWWWFEGGSHEIFTNREGGSTIFLLLPGGIKNLTESFIPFLPHPPPPPVSYKMITPLVAWEKSVQFLTLRQIWNSLLPFISYQFDAFFSYFYTIKHKSLFIIRKHWWHLQEEHASIKMHENGIW